MAPSGLARRIRTGGSLVAALTLSLSLSLLGFEALLTWWDYPPRDPPFFQKDPLTGVSLRPHAEGWFRTEGGPW